MDCNLLLDGHQPMSNPNHESTIFIDRQQWEQHLSFSETPAELGKLAHLPNLPNISANHSQIEKRQHVWNLRGHPS